MEAKEESKKTSIKELFKYRDYLIILIANFISRFGDSIDSIAYGWMVYLLTGSKLLLGTLYAVNSLPNILFGPFAGVIADRFNKKKIIIFVYTGRGIMVSLTALLFFTGLLRPWHLFIITIINSTLETLSSPIFISIIPRLLPEELYFSGNSFSSSAYKFAELIGLGATGAIIALMGITGAIFIDGGTFFVAAVLIIFLKIKHEKAETSKISARTYINDLKEGFSFIRKSYVIRTTIILFAIVNFCLAPINVLLPAYISDILKSGAGMLSLVGVSLTVGIILGGLIIGMISKKIKKYWLICLGLIFFGISYSLLFFPGKVVAPGTYSNVIAIVVFFIFGLIIPMMNTPLITNIMLNTDKNMLGRVGSFLGMIGYSAIPLGAAVTGSISEVLPMTSIFLIMGIIIIFLGVIMLFNIKFKKLAG